MAKTGGKDDARERHGESNQQSREDVTEAGLQGSEGRFASGPSALASQQNDRHPMVGDDGMEDADRGDGADQK